jgi:hypothetical protein
MKSPLSKTFLCTAVVGMAAMASVASADLYTFDFTTYISGDSPAGSAWATMTIEDIGADTVRITMDHNATSEAGSFISDLWFNLDPFVTVTSSNYNPGSTFNGSIIQSENGITNAGLMFDLNQAFTTSSSGDRLLPGESASFELSGSGLSASDFLSNAIGDPNDVLAMIHLQSVAGGEGSVKLGATDYFPPVPEPASMAALGLGAVALLRRRKSAK